MPAYNESFTIAQTLDSLALCADRAKRLVNASVEIVVVDNGSTDDTATVAAHIGVRCIDEPLPGAGAARNAGARATRGDYIVFVDADVRVSPLFLVALDIAINGGDLRAGAPTAIYRPKKLGSWFICAYWDRRRARGGPAQGVGQFYERALFETLGGYNAEMRMSEDVDLYIRAGEHLRAQLLPGPKIVPDSIIWPSTRRYDEWSNLRMILLQNAWIVGRFTRSARLWKSWRENAIR
ncbi:glycosyltransferase [Leifsonia sp. RAF41]|uniref:glycosyltransferase n=1 Tax=Leifsonia sp. RAF41 TaxID=3233056 RepID=UPI003F99155C